LKEEKMKRTIKIFVVAALVFCAVPLMAQRGPGGKGRHGGPGGRPEGPGMKGMMHEMMLEEAGVPESKRAEIRKKAHEIHKQMMEINFQIRELRLQTKKEYEKKKPSAKVLKDLNSKIAELRKKQFLVMGNFKIEVHLSLTSEQREKLLELGKKNRRKFINRMGPPSPDWEDENLDD
jgi:Spy/CpxP family protein refolding chaperone